MKKNQKKVVKKKLQKYTNADKKVPPSNPYDILELHYQMAIDFRLYNMGHEQIAFEINRAMKKLKIKKEYREGSIRDWFAKGGICVKGYEYKKALLTKENALRIKDVDKKLLEAMADAVVVVHDRIRKHSLQASLETIKIVKGQKKDDKPVVNNTVVYIPANGR